LPQAGDNKSIESRFSPGVPNALPGGFYHLTLQKKGCSTFPASLLNGRTSLKKKNVRQKGLRRRDPESKGPLPVLHKNNKAH
jgi:hypothetical protein